jgi:hypothetical protein
MVASKRAPSGFAESSSTVPETESNVPWTLAIIMCRTLKRAELCLGSI